MELKLESKGCVYFFRHIGLTPVKIGFSTNESPIVRFEQFKTYAPYGAELVGFIRTMEPNKLEAILHERFSSTRVKGEWFEITDNEIRSVVNFYSNIEDVKERNEFEIAWAKKIERNNKENYSELEGFFNNKYSVISRPGFSEFKVFQKSELFKEFPKKDLKIILKKINAIYTTHRVDKIYKKGIKLYISDVQLDDNYLLT